MKLMRRTIIVVGPLAAMAIGTLACALAQTEDFATTDRGSKYLSAARQTAKWLQTQSIRKDDRASWPSDPADPASVNSTLYSGGAGVVLFFLEAHHATGDPEYLELARQGANVLLESGDGELSLGLYDGLAGTAFALLETHQATGDPRYRQAAMQQIDQIIAGAKRVGAGVEWNESTDIISGSAGIGLVLLTAARELDRQDALDMARESGLRLIEMAQHEQGGLTWPMTPTFERQMPNFSHGTAGVAYFLATLYEATQDKQFLDAAVSGANYIQSIAQRGDDGFMVYHHRPGGEEIFYLGFCHGPPGTARLFCRLHQLTQDGRWLELMERSAHSIVRAGLPKARTTGYWNNVSQCCGSAGIADFFLQMHQLVPSRDYLRFSDAMTEDLLSRATDDVSGMRWLQAEHRVRPDERVAQTGYMQGAAGIGMWLLHRYQFERGQPRRVVFPDSPYRENNQGQQP